MPFFILIGQSGLLPTLLDCSELYRAGFILPGFYKIDPTGNSSPSLGRNAFCENGWTHILRRMPTDQGQVDTKSLCINNIISNILSMDTKVGEKIK